MARISYRTLQVPKRGRGAFSPPPAAIGTAATNGQNVVTGSPGTTPVPVSRPPALASSDIGGPLWQSSAVAPDVIYPSVYVAHANPTLHFPGSLHSDHVLPVPALNPTRVPISSRAGVRWGGRAVTPSIRPFTRYPVIGQQGA